MKATVYVQGSITTGASCLGSPPVAEFLVFDDEYGTFLLHNPSGAHHSASVTAGIGFDFSETQLVYEVARDIEIDDDVYDEARQRALLLHDLASRANAARSDLTSSVWPALAPTLVRGLPEGHALLPSGIDLFSQEIENAPIPADSIDYLLNIGVRYIGEAYTVESGTPGSVTKLKLIMLELDRATGIPIDTDPIEQGWRPQYWRSSPLLYAWLNRPIAAAGGGMDLFVDRTSMIEWLDSQKALAKASGWEPPKRTLRGAMQWQLADGNQKTRGKTPSALIHMKSFLKRHKVMLEQGVPLHAAVVLPPQR